MDRAEALKECYQGQMIKKVVIRPPSRLTKKPVSRFRAFVDKSYQTSTRLVELAKPKISKSIWITSERPSVQWGTQETLWPASKAALNAAATKRLEELSRPKPLFQRGERLSRPQFLYDCGRVSTIWELSEATQRCKGTNRLKALCKPKKVPSAYLEDRPNYTYSCGRSSPIWNISRTTLTAAIPPRIDELAKPSPLHAELLGIDYGIPEKSNKKADADRLDTLAQPKEHQDGPYRSADWSVPDTAMKASASPRCGALSQPKPLSDAYRMSRSVVWAVPHAALHARCTPRVERLSQPNIRESMNHVQYDPDAFRVKTAATQARCSSRVAELAQPTARQ